MTPDPSPTMFAAIDSFVSRFGDAIILIGRILFGWLLLISGWAKLMNIGGITGYLTSLGVPSPAFWAWPAMIAELVLGSFLILGLATRYAAIGTVVYVLITTAIAHRYWEFAPPRQIAEYINFLKNISIMGGALAFLVVGAGRFSLDGVMRRK